MYIYRIYNFKVGDLIRGLGFKPTNKDIAEILGNPKKEEMNTSTCNFDQFLGYVKQAGEKQKEGTYEDFVEGMFKYKIYLVFYSEP